jgi:non-ribosomal peptide synthetase-like protein
MTRGVYDVVTPEDAVLEDAPADTTTASAPGALACGTEEAFAEVLAGIMGTEQVSVDAHFFDDLGADSMLMARFCARVRKRADLPSASMPDVYQHPTIRSLAAALLPVDPTAGPAQAMTPQVACERGFAEMLAGIMGTEHVPVDAHFFDDLGADSMLMARFCARVRKRADLPTVSMPDVYQHPTIRSLAVALAGTAPTPAPEPAAPAAPAALVEPPRRARNGDYILCGALQLLFILGYPALTMAIAAKGIEWIAAGRASLVDLYLRSAVFGGAMFLGLCTVPILLKWVLIGRWRPQEIRVWSLAYLRFWFVKTLVQRSPMALLLGSPLYAVYLRALGAKIGRGAVILSKVPVCTDLLSIGDGAIVRKDSVLNGYRAHNGFIQTGPVSLGKDAFVGEATVLDIWTSLGDGAQLGHSSSLHAGQSVPDGERWHGSPARPTDVEYRRVPTLDVGSRRRTIFATVQLANMLLAAAPAMFVIVIEAFIKIPDLTALLSGGRVPFTTWAFYALVVSTVLFFSSALIGLVFVRIVPRVLNRFIEPDKVYPLYGFHWWVHRAIARTSNLRFYMRLLGDTSAVVHYLRWVGYDLRGVRQTGSNFGEVVKHDNPFLSAVGSGTVCADGLSIINADVSSTSFRLSQVSIPGENFLGNRIPYPSHAKVGENCLLGTMVMVPLDGQLREGVGLLGSPSFEIPRSVKRDKELEVENADELRRGLHAKNIHNTATVALMLLTQWFPSFLVSVLYLAAVDLWASLGALGFALATAALLVFSLGFNILVDVLSRPLMALRPQGCSIYDLAFWQHERFWKLSLGDFVSPYNGTPMKSALWRLMGVRIGRGVFDDGLGLPERSWVTIGDDCTFNLGSTIQCHSQEDGGFKSDRVTIGAGCTFGVGAWAHYGVTMGDGAVLATDSFLMKGEEVPPQALWGGNPAKEMREQPAFVPLPRASIDDNPAAVFVSGA